MDLIYREPSYPPFVEYMKTLPLLYLQRQDPDYPNSVAYPLKEMLVKYGRYFFTSSLAYMMALAIEKNPEKIGIWGVDMSAEDEYGYQRAGCHYFIQKALDAGIMVHVPPESDLLEPLPLYGFKERNRMYRKMLSRKLELEAELEKLKNERIQNAAKEHQYIGALQSHLYVMKTFDKED